MKSTIAKASVGLGVLLGKWVGACVVVLAVLAGWQAVGAPVSITVQVDRPGPRINPAMWGVFFEDINLGADGGLYAELVKNRSFEFPDPLMGWSQLAVTNGAGTWAILDQAPFHPANPHYLRLTSENDLGWGVANEGFRGMGIREGEWYDFSARIRSSGNRPRALRLELVGPRGNVLAFAKLDGFATDWKKQTATLRANATEAKARLNLVVEGRGALDLDMVSLFPRKTWQDRPGGLRADLVQMLAAMKPGFVRFPGGCIVEGHYLTNRYQWKTTIGPVEERKLIVNRWNDEFKHRPTPDYYQSFGLGFFEFFQLCEDIGAEPLPILNCGMACQFNSGELAPLDQLDPYVQDALDLVEFANGPASSKWGARRVAMGHPAPFRLKLLGVGNEQWGPQYIERYAVFAKALKQRYPDVQLVSSAGPGPSDDRFEFAWGKLRELKADIIDEHCYAAPQWFLDNAGRYDHYNRQGPKVFMGEYAAQSVGIASPLNRNNLECALAEAAYMTGLERNADVVRMSSYAPLFSHIEGWQWTPDLIWCDNLRVYGTPNYYVQQCFARNRGDVVLPTQLQDNRPPAPPAGRIGLSTYHTEAEFKEVRVTRNETTLFAPNFDQGCADWSPLGGKWGVEGGVYRQTDRKAVCRTLAGETTWSDYSLSLKARKLGGDEGFIIIVRHAGPDTQVQWNLGGWGNQQHGIQVLGGGQEKVLQRVPGSIETNRWYDIRIDLAGTRVTCFLDGQPVQTADIAAGATPRLFASAVKDEATGQILLKVVNPTPAATVADIKLAGLSRVGSRAELTVLAGTAPGDENSFENPVKVAPVTTPIASLKPEFHFLFPSYSMSVLRVGMER